MYIIYVFVFALQMMNDHEDDSPDSCIKKVG